MNFSNILIITKPERAVAVSEMFKESNPQAVIFNNFVEPSMSAEMAQEASKNNRIITIAGGIDPDDFEYYDGIFQEEVVCKFSIKKLPKTLDEFLNTIKDA